MSLDRRTFVKSSFAAVTTMSVSALSYGQIAGANERFRCGVIGFRSRGQTHLECVQASDRARLVALCDVDAAVLGKAEADNTSLVRTQDYRQLLDRGDIDVILSATPNHWHALLTVLACQAGKHVYIEKPISHNMQEGAAIVRAARHTGQLVQCGFQNRSDTALLPFFSALHGGEFGKVLHVHGTCHRARDPIGKLDRPWQVPDNIAYDLWLGPAADQPIYRPELHYDWHWDFTTGNGDVGNQGPHEWDLMHWALGNPEILPTRIRAAGNRFAWQDAGNTPNVLAVCGQSGDVPFCFEVMDLQHGRQAPRDCGVGVVIQTEKGIFVGGRGGGRFEHNDGRITQFAREEPGADGTLSQFNNLLDAIESDDPAMLRSESARAANSAAMAHMANISYQLAGPATAVELESAFNNSLEQRDMVARLRESTMMFAIEQRNAEVLPWLLGPELSFDGVAFEFAGECAAEANARMGREYRTGFAFSQV